MSMNKGFTMIETLFVLFVICMLSTLTMRFSLPKKSEDRIISEISSFIYQAQVQAMTKKETVQFTFDANVLSYSSKYCNETYQLDNGSSFEKYQFTFNEYGRIKTAKTISCYIHEHHYQFVFQLGSGCFYVK